MAKRKRARKPVTLRKWVVKLWLPVVRSQLKESTFDSYRRNMDLHVLPCLGEMQLEAITPRALTSLYVELLESGRLNGDRRGLSPKTVRYIHTIVHKALADAVDDGRLKSNPAERAKAPKPGRTGGRELRFWEPHQLAQFLEHIRDSELAALWHLAAFTGMRRGELLGLRWADIDFKHRRLSIRRSVVSVAYRVVDTTPKTHHARVVDLDEASITILRAHHIRRVEMAAEMGETLEGDDRVFCRSNGRVLHPMR